MSTQGRMIDPRVQRTRQLLQQAFAALVKEKDIRKISVQDIVERATVNRATFYAHFADKYELIESWFHEEFQRMLRNELPEASTLQRRSLHALILTVFKFFAEIHDYCKNSNSMSLKEFEDLFMAVIQKEVTVQLFTWLKQLPSSKKQLLEPLEMTVHVVSWTILGPAIQWSHETEAFSAEKMAQHITQVTIGHLSNISIPE